MHKILWDHLISTKRPAKKKKKKKIQRKNSKSEKKTTLPSLRDIEQIKEKENVDKYLDIVRELKKSSGTWVWQ